MTAYDYHAEFVKATGSGISQREYARAFDVEYAEIREYRRNQMGRFIKPAELREETAERLAQWYREAVTDDTATEDRNVYILTHGEYGGQITDLERAEALYRLVTVHRISYVIMVAAAAVDRATRAAKGGE